MKTTLTLAVALLLALAFQAVSSEIHDAAKQGDLAAVQAILSETPDLLEAADEDGLTPLLAAAEGGNLELVKSLVDRGANLHATSPRGSTALHIASFEGKADVVEYLLGKGLDINATTNSGFSPLMYAAYGGHKDAAEILIRQGADHSTADNRWGGTAIHWACNRDHVEILELLHANGFDLRQASPTDSSTPIFWAAYGGKVDAIRFLVDNGVDPGETEPDGWTPLHNAARRGHIDAVQFLAERGAPVDARDDEGTTPLFAAAWDGQLQMVKLLAGLGADLHQVDDDGLSVLHLGVMSGDTAFARYLIDAGVDVNQKDSGGTTPLVRTIYRGHTQVAALLLDAGAEVNTVDAEGITPLMRSVILAQDSLAQLLLSHGATVGHREQQSQKTELHFAAIKGSRITASELLARGADPAAVDADGQTPLHYAARYGHQTVAELLAGDAGLPDGMDNNFGRSPILEESFADGEAAVWYTGHCGFAIKTANHLLLFDYYNTGTDPDEPLLANGHINPEEIGDQNLTVFVTHEHGDHYDTSTHGWSSACENISYVYGFQAADLQQYAETGYNGPAYEYVGPHERKEIGNMVVHAIVSNDGGAGFLVEVDGLRIFHAGDHAGWIEDQREGFTSEIDYLVELVSDVDMAFMNVTGCHHQDTVALEESICYTFDKLNPKCWFPTHGSNNERVYRTFADKIARRGYTCEAACAENRGDCFIYRNGSINAPEGSI